MYMITLILVHSPTYIEETCSVPGIVISTGMSFALILAVGQTLVNYFHIGNLHHLL